MPKRTKLWVDPFSFGRPLVRIHLTIAVQDTYLYGTRLTPVSMKNLTFFS